MFAYTLAHSSYQRLQRQQQQMLIDSICAVCLHSESHFITLTGRYVYDSMHKHSRLMCAFNTRQCVSLCSYSIVLCNQVNRSSIFRSTHFLILFFFSFFPFLFLVSLSFAFTSFWHFRFFDFSINIAWGMLYSLARCATCERTFCHIWSIGVGLCLDSNFEGSVFG